ncbi:MAG: extracellular solute-binding protein [Synechococcus sp.]
MKAILASCYLMMLPLSAAASQGVRVYSGRHYNTDRKVFKKFSDATGIKVRLLESKGASLVERLRREGSNSKADVILLVDAARINRAAELGLFSPITSTSLLDDVPSRYRDPDNRWFGLTRRVRVMVVNPRVVSASRVKTYADLADSSLKGKLCLRRRDNVCNQSLVADQIALNGVDAIKNDSRECAQILPSLISRVIFL